MSVVPIPRPLSKSPHSQRRHYDTHQLCNLQNRLLKYDLQSRTLDSIYTKDFTAFESVSNANDRRSRKKIDNYAAPLADLKKFDQHMAKFPGSGIPSQKHVDKLMYMSSYQAAYTINRKKLEVDQFRYTDDTDLRSERRRMLEYPTTESLYHDSYTTHQMNQSNELGNPGKKHVMTKLLYQSPTPMLTVTDLLNRNAKPVKTTSYKFDYRNLDEFKRIPQPDMPSKQYPAVPRAVKYRRWASQ
ncbi:hypothetical protein BDEG_23510 [Batrachochytrium dendrobatidis JEL423]|uniref:Uncharacterized protein n=1 Tax=Batrachochytrium dendrobatidis (strain JEL423) TaxID=403673 RepID=A0A177WJN3_BATDL|nr:hypothetical protein BDEG_23510 [Batrachochytrium dendrobatidis JEL423]